MKLKENVQFKKESMKILLVHVLFEITLTWCHLCLKNLDLFEITI